MNDLEFGKIFTDHMIRIHWVNGAWQTPKITPFENLSLHPGSKVLHYAQELFEGMKAYRGQDNAIRLFRPYFNMVRMVQTAKRCSLPVFEVFVCCKSFQ